MPTVLDLADRFHAALERQDAQALERIIRAYAGIQSRLQGEIDALALEIERDGLTAGKVAKLARYKRILAQTADEVDKFTRFMEVDLSGMGREYVGRGLRESRELMRAAVGDNAALTARFRDLPPETVERLLGFLDPAGPLYARLKLLPGFVADAVSRAILDSVALGRNPRMLASELTRAFGMGLSDSLRMARTVQLWSYREATRANYAANGDVVKGWQWYASLDNLTCMSCVAQHGTIHPLDEPLNDHHNGRCAALPVTILSPKGHIDQDAGQQWFNGLSEAEQKQMMGPGRFEAWKDGKFEFGALSAERKDDVYGMMRGETSLKDLLDGGREDDANVLDLSGISSRADVAKIFDRLAEGEYSVEIHGVTLNGLNRATFRDVNLYYGKASRGQVEDLAISLESFRRNNGDEVFNKLFGEVKSIAFTESGHISGSSVLATGGQGKILVYKNQFLGYEEMIHEAGHTAGNKDYIVEALSKFTAQGELSPTGYGRANIDEDIAETIRTYFMEPQRLQWDHENRYQLMKEFFGD
jgi:hypothetical protein